MSSDKSDQNLILMIPPPHRQDDVGEGPELQGSQLLGEERSLGAGASQHGDCIHHSAS